MNDLCRLGLVEAARQIRERRLSPVDLLEGHLEQIQSVEHQVHAWVSLDVKRARATARERLVELEATGPHGPLHGIPFAIKDLYHATGMVTTGGAAPFAHERPLADAVAVRRLKEAGGVLLGKTTTTEFAFTDPAETRNPWNLDHTPGGSSSGSAAAVAARMVPLALGSQTVGSTLRPAAYCGVVGFKPTFGFISCSGLLPLAWSFDHVGLFVRSVADLALVLQVLVGFDPADLASWPVEVPDYEAILTDPETLPPRLGIPRSLADRASAETAAHLETVVAELRRGGAHVRDLALPSSFDDLHETGLTVVQAEAATSHAARFARHRDEYRPRFRAFLESGLSIPATAYVSALRQCRQFRRDMEGPMADLDALLLPVAPAPAPRGLSSTGDPTFCSPWSFAGMPAIALPSGVSEAGLPFGIQVVGGNARDADLLRTARWCEGRLKFAREPEILGG